jgi:hypothetical protein
MAIDKDQVLGQIVQFIVGFFSKGDTPMVSVEIPLEVDTAKIEVPVFKVSKDELLMGRDKQYALEYSQLISDNLDKLLVPINKIGDAWGKPMKVNSGWRPPEINDATPGAAAHSKHMEGLAVDFSDPDGELLKWTLNNLQLMEELGIFMEDFRWTKGWVHYQIGAPSSGRRIFVPSTARPSAPDAWDGNYDHSTDQVMDKSV